MELTISQITQFIFANPQHFEGIDPSVDSILSAPNSCSTCSLVALENEKKLVNLFSKEEILSKVISKTSELCFGRTIKVIGV